MDTWLYKLYFVNTVYNGKKYIASSLLSLSPTEAVGSQLYKVRVFSF